MDRKIKRKIEEVKHVFEYFLVSDCRQLGNTVFKFDVFTW